MLTTTNDEEPLTTTTFPPDARQHPTFEYWRQKAIRIDKVPPRGEPLGALLRGARSVARFTRKYWQATPERAGLEAAGPKLPPNIAEQIDSLVDAIEQTHAAYLGHLPRSGESEKLMRRGADLLLDLQAGLDWHLHGLDTDRLDLDAHDPYVLAGDEGSPGELAEALRDYAALAELFRDALSRVPGFELTVVREALDLARKLEQIDRAEDASDERRALIELRERLAYLLQNRLSLVRAATRYVFRHEASAPELESAGDFRFERAARRRAEILLDRRRRANTEYLPVPHPN